MTTRYGINADELLREFALDKALGFLTDRHSVTKEDAVSTAQTFYDFLKAGSQATVDDTESRTAKSDPVWNLDETIKVLDARIRTLLKEMKQ